MERALEIGFENGDVDAGLDLTRDPACDKGEWVVVMRGTVEDATGYVERLVDAGVRPMRRR